MTRSYHYAKPAELRKKRVRAKVVSTTGRPRLSVFRSNKYLYAQVIDDATGKTLAAISDKKASEIEKKKLTKSEKAQASAKLLAEILKKKSITALVFDRGQYKYHGRIKTFAEELRAQGVTI